MAPVYSIIVPAYNEEAWLGRSLPSARQAMAAIESRGELIVVDNNSSDRTAEVARAHGASVVFEPFNQISLARNCGARAAAGQHLIFLDADTLLSPELLRAALEHLATGTCVGGGALVATDQPIAGLPSLGLWSWNWISRLYGSAAGCFVYCLREGFEQVGGFSEKVYATEELWLCRALRIWGRQRGMVFTIITEPPIVTSNRKLEQSWHVLMMVSMFLFFPFAMFSRRMCSYWYRRPAAEEATEPDP